MISEKLKSHIENVLQNKFSIKIEILSLSPLSGGCINECYSVETNANRVFLKLNKDALYPKMFDTEATGLRLLKATKTIHVPEVISYGNESENAFLILEFIEAGIRKKSFYEDFAMQLAQLHKSSSESFGLDFDNYIGSLKQSNRKHKSWISFFIEERLNVQIKFARDKGAIDLSTMRKFDTLFNRLNEVLPLEKPSLLHGDLWSGNYLTGKDGYACLIDPAVYYGFREMDIAMTRLFGGFPPEFYQAYQFHFPMEKGWEDRLELCNLYPLLVHVNLFGENYLAEIKRILKRYS